MHTQNCTGTFAEISSHLMWYKLYKFKSNCSAILWIILVNIYFRLTCLEIDNGCCSMGTSHKLHFGGQVSPNPVDPPPVDQLHLHSLAIRKCIDIVMFLSAPNNRCVFTSLLQSHLHGSFQARKKFTDVLIENLWKDFNIWICVWPGKTANKSDLLDIK